MIADIEEAALARLRDNGLQAVEYDVGAGVEKLIKPSVLIATDEGRFEKAAASAYRQTLTVSVYVLFRHLKNEKGRRLGVYPILEGIAGILTLQALGLDITPLRPVGFRNATTDGIEASGGIAFKMDFSTSYLVSRMDDEKAADLLKTGLSYYLQPGDDVKDAEDVVTHAQ